MWDFGRYLLSIDPKSGNRFYSNSCDTQGADADVRKSSILGRPGKLYDFIKPHRGIVSVLHQVGTSLSGEASDHPNNEVIHEQYHYY